MPLLYQQMLGKDFGLLSPLLQTLHGAEQRPWLGQANVKWGKPIFIRILLYLAMRLGILPAEGQNVRCQVKIQQDAKGEIWQRRFAQNPMQSRQSWRNGGLWEQMGPLALQLHSHVSEGQLLQSSQTARCFGLPLPLQVKAREWAIDEVMHFDVEIGFKKGGMILHYTGELRQVAEC
ncbi:DUF4166 domain-containing protein [Iodobacter fluviatilis]|uniref:Uncharacterized protein DUF4166 n=1 Tax=Iodobacter fluviatilis TaxID=537 RepID=A0A377Q3S7_9NEIS|nr:DUF4166 domain-containing protein [Iodobacter fluviatilis]TCU90440.1 uncharacterized protein DUF4166 [Iodobacter fluviatilis]STQ89467.1 Uncharacterised protein [Iodobacter fluviatilis]